MAEGGESSAAARPRAGGRARVLRAIRSAGRLARVEIARRTGISPATVTALTAELLAEGLIERTGAPGPGTGRGRPREALKIRGAARLVAGAMVTQRAVAVLLVDFEGVEIGAHALPRAAPVCAPETLAREVAAAVAAACAAHGRDPAQVAGIGLGLAGQVDGGRGLVHWSSALDRRSVDLGRPLTAATPCPVFLENDANLVAKAEQLFGLGRAASDFLVVTLQHGVGLGIVVGGRLYRGARGCGGEFGHTVVAPDGPLCQCGRRGCLEAFAGGYALRARAAEAGVAVACLTELAGRAAAGHPGLAEALREARAHFAAGLANLVTLFDPELVILAVEAEGAHPLCTPDVLSAARARSVRVEAPPEIVVHGWGEAMWTKGAAAYAIERVEALSARRAAPAVQPDM
jgi:predicted NBD/HSP70 family sugar kinase